MEILAATATHPKLNKLISRMTATTVITGFGRWLMEY